MTRGVAADLRAVAVAASRDSTTHRENISTSGRGYHKWARRDQLPREI